MAIAMQTFPVTSSILSSSSIAAFVATQYGFSPATTCKLLKTGINHTYRIDSGSEIFIFRIYSYQWRSKEEISEEIRLLQLLKQHNIPVSYAVADSEGNFIQSLQAPEGERYGVLFSFAKGQKILQFDEATHYEVGKLMANMHSITKNMQLERITYSPDILLVKSLEQIKQFLPADGEEMQFLIKTLPILQQRLQNADSNLLRKGIVHMDIWFDNLNINNNKEVTLFDFDFCGNGWLWLDMAYYILQLHSTEKDEAERTKKIHAFYNGYETIETITEEERRLIPTLGVCMYYFYLGVQCNRFENWSNSFLNEVYLKRFISILVKGYYEQTCAAITID